MSVFLDDTRPVVIALLVLVFVYQLPRIAAAPRDRAALALIIGAAASAIGWMVTAPGLSRSLDRWTGLTDISALIVQLLAAAVFSPALLIAVITWSHPSAAARRESRYAVIYGLIVASIMSALWVVAAADDTHPLAHLDRPIVMVYRVFYLISFDVGLVMLIRLSAGYARLSDDRWLRRGLRVAAVGASGYLIVSAARLFSIPARWLGHDPAAWEPLAGLGIRLGALGILVGLTLPSLAASGRRCGAWWRQVRSARTLRTLWRDLTDAFPQARLFGDELTQLSYLRVAELDYLVSRYVIEIRDCWRALRPYLPEPPDRVDTMSERQLADAAAASLRIALLAKASGHPGTIVSAVCTLERLETADLEDDIAWLVRVGRAYAAGRSSLAATEHRQTAALSSPTPDQ